MYKRADDGQRSELVRGCVMRAYDGYWGELVKGCGTRGLSDLHNTIVMIKTITAYYFCTLCIFYCRTCRDLKY